MLYGALVVTTDMLRRHINCRIIIIIIIITTATQSMPLASVDSYSVL